MKFHLTCTEPIQKASFGVTGVELLRFCFNCIPFVTQLKWTSWDFVSLLAKYLNHIDESLRIAASDALTRIMKLPEVFIRHIYPLIYPRKLTEISAHTTEPLYGRQLHDLTYPRYP